jgi:hypothetical protein
MPGIAFPDAIEVHGVPGGRFVRETASCPQELTS